MVVSWRVAGSHRAPVQMGVEPLYDGADLALTMNDGSVRALGIRCTDLMSLDPPARDQGWDDGYLPIAVDLDVSTVAHWNFDELLWVGPEPQPCLFWSNALGFTVAGFGTVLGLDGVGVLLGGRRGAGLPLWNDVARPQAMV